MPHNKNDPPDTHAADGRREVDAQWRSRMEREIADVGVRLGKIERGLGENTISTNAIKEQLAEHVDRTEKFVRKMAPAGTAVDYYTSGVRVIGMIGEAFQWCAKWLARFLKFVAPVAAAFAAVYATWPAESRAIIEWLKFWRHP